MFDIYYINTCKLFDNNFFSHLCQLVMISDMLFLAKTEHGLCLPSFQPVDLCQEVGALFEFYDALAAEKGMGLLQTGEATIQGDALMLRRALSNLLSKTVNVSEAKPT